MQYDELTDREKEVWDFAFAAGTEAEDNGDAWSEAYNEGYADGEEEGYNAGIYSAVVEEQVEEARTEGYNEGVKAEQGRIQYILNMMFESALNMGQGNKAVQYKHAMDLLRPINIDYSEEAYQRQMEADGF